MGINPRYLNVPDGGLHLTKGEEGVCKVFKTDIARVRRNFVLPQYGSLLTALRIYKPRS